MFNYFNVPPGQKLLFFEEFAGEYLFDSTYIQFDPSKITITDQLDWHRAARVGKQIGFR